MVTGKIIQTYQGMKAFYRAVIGDCLYADAEVPYNIAFGSILCNVSEGGRYRLDYDFRNPLPSWSREIRRRREYLGYGILDENGRVAGYICQKREGRFFGGYAYYIVSFGKCVYHVYCVPMGKEGLKYPMYFCAPDREVQVGLMEKPCAVDDMLDVYNFRVREHAHVLPLVLYALCVDILYHGNQGRIPAKSREASYKVTFNKRLKAKYHTFF